MTCLLQKLALTFTVASLNNKEHLDVLQILNLLGKTELAVTHLICTNATAFIIHHHAEFKEVEQIKDRSADYITLQKHNGAYIHHMVIITVLIDLFFLLIKDPFYFG